MVELSKPADLNSLNLTGWVATNPVVRQSEKESRPTLHFMVTLREQLVYQTVTSTLPVVAKSPHLIAWAEKALEKGHRIAIAGRQSIRKFPGHTIPGYKSILITPYVQAYSIVILHLATYRNKDNPAIHPTHLDRVEDLGLAPLSDKPAPTENLDDPIY